MLLRGRPLLSCREMLVRLLEADLRWANLHTPRSVLLRSVLRRLTYCWLSRLLILLRSFCTSASLLGNEFHCKLQVAYNDRSNLGGYHTPQKFTQPIWRSGVHEMTVVRAYCTEI